MLASSGCSSSYSLPVLSRRDTTASDSHNVLKTPLCFSFPQTISLGKGGNWLQVIIPIYGVNEMKRTPSPKVPGDSRFHPASRPDPRISVPQKSAQVPVHTYCTLPDPCTSHADRYPALLMGMYVLRNISNQILCNHQPTHHSQLPSTQPNPNPKCQQSTMPPDTEELARGYTLLNNTQYSAGLFLISRLALTPGQVILDVGCGPGNLTSHLAHLVGPQGTVIGIDPSKERIAIANSQTPFPNLSFHEGQAEDLSRFAPASFDVVFVNSTLHWVQDQETAIREFARVLRPNGKLGISGGSGDFVTYQERVKGEVLGREPYCGYREEAPPRFLTRRELEGLLDRAEGLGKREMVVNRIVKSAEGPDEMIDWLDASSSGKTYGGIPVQLRARAREEMKREWEGYVTGEGIQMAMELLVTVAVKSG